MIELSIPQAGEETKNAKDLVFSILSEKQPLSIIEIVNIINKQYNVGLTYQAVKKAIDLMLVKNVLVKEGKYYKINKEWLMNLKIAVDNLLTNYESGKKIHNFKAEIAKEDYAVYTFTNLLDLDNFWDDMLIYLTDNLKENEPKVFVTRTHYSWWLLINLGRETKLFHYFIKKNIKCYNLNIGNFPLNQWAGKIYNDLGVKFEIIEDKKMEEAISLNILGDTVIQIKYPKQIIFKLKKFYKKYKSTQEMSLKEITQLVQEPCEIKFNIFKNAEIAQSLREKYLKIFK